MNMKKFGMRAKLAALLMALVLLVSVLPVMAEEAAKPVSVYVTVSNGGVFEETKDGEPAVRLNVETDTGNTIGDIMLALHEQYSANGAEDYATADSDYGAYIVKLWGVETSNCGYYLNGQMAYGLTDAVADGDTLEVILYVNAYPDTEAYASFNQMTAEAGAGEDVALVLYSASFDENYNMIMNPCEGAVIIVNGEATDLVTDAEGNATVNFAEAGTYIVSATLTKMVGDLESTAIAAPVCVVTVE